MHPEIERVKENFSPDKIRSAQLRTWDALRSIAAAIEPGMLETEARKLADAVLKEKGAERFWHRTHVRFGVNTLKSFSDDSLPGVRLQARDIFFLDIGPVFEGYEGDAGETFALGSDREMQRCALDARALFEAVSAYWAETGAAGHELYRFATVLAKKKGWDFILRGASGHRISDFPHVLYHRGNLASAGFTPAAQRWILEIQLRHPTRHFGAFYEDMLG